MNTTTTANTTPSELATSGALKWTPAEILEANFMFPVNDYKSAEELEKDSEESFCLMIEEMLTPCQPLNNFERVGLVASVKSGNRLRVLYHTVQIVGRHAIAADETHKVEMPDEEVQGSQEGRGYQTHQIGTDCYSHDRGLDIGDKSIENMDNQIPSYEESNKGLSTTK